MDYKAYFGGNIKYNLFSEEIGWHVLSQRSFYGVVPAFNEATPRLRQCAAKTFIDESPCLQCTQLSHLLDRFRQLI